VTAERKKKHIALKLPFEAGREILGSSKKTWRQGASCSCQANTEQQRKHIALKAVMPPSIAAWYFPDNCKAV